MLRKSNLIILILLTILIFPGWVYAKEKMDVYIPPGTVLAGNYYAVGNTIEMAGSVESDLIVAGGNVIISGAVGGDVIAAGGNIRIIGPVGGNVRVLGGNVDIYGPVARNVTVASGTLVISESSEISGHVTAGTGSLELRGKINGGVLAGAGAVIVAGFIKGPVNIYLEKAGTLDIRETAITGDVFNYYASQSARISEGAQLSQTPQLHELVKQSPQPVWWWNYLISLFSALVLGMVLTSLAPRKVEEISEEALANPWRSLGWGILWAAVVPIIALVLLITIIGWPLSFALGAFYLFSLILATALAGAILGWYVKSLAKESWLGKQSIMTTVLIGIFIYKLVVFIPILGGLIAFVGTLLAWGAMLRAQSQLLKSFR